MSLATINGVKLYWELTGNQGDPLVLVHGSWGDHHNWGKVIGELAKKFRVLTYDRRGHSQSERPSDHETVDKDIDDLIALIEYFKLSPAHIAGNSYGAGIVLKTAAKKPELFKSMVIHEPPLFGLLKDNPEAQNALQVVNERLNIVFELIKAGRVEKATEEFMEKIGMGPGTWDKLPEIAQKTFIYNAPTWYDEMLDPDSLQLDLSTLSVFKKPALMSIGSESPPFFPLVIDKIKVAIPHAQFRIIEGAGHVPHMSHPEQYIEMVSKFCLVK